MNSELDFSNKFLVIFFFKLFKESGHKRDKSDESCTDFGHFHMVMLPCGFCVVAGASTGQVTPCFPAQVPTVAVILPTSTHPTLTEGFVKVFFLNQ